MPKGKSRTSASDVFQSAYNLAKGSLGPEDALKLAKETASAVLSGKNTPAQAFGRISVAVANGHGDPLTRERIIQTLKATDGDVQGAAWALGVHADKLLLSMARLDVPRGTRT